MTIIKELNALHVNGEEYKFPAGEGDMKYADFSLVEKTGATVTLDLFSYVEPSANFTVNAPSEIKEGQEYILRVENGATAYTMTLGTNITNPYSASTTLTANGIDQFVFLAVDGILELQPAVCDFDIKDLDDSGGLRNSWTSKQDALIAGRNITINSDGRTINTTGITAGSNITIETKCHMNTQGPCPDGFHIPSKVEFQTIQSIFSGLSISFNCSNISSYLKIPLAGHRGDVNLSQPALNISQQGSGLMLRSCDAVSASEDEYLSNVASWYLYAANNSTGISEYGYRFFAMSIRPFKDTPIAADSSWTTLFNGSSVAAGAGIFWNETLGLISLSSDGQSWITISDKNLGATEAGTTSSSYGYFYQRGNNGGIPSTGSLSQTTTTRIDASGYGPLHYYSSTVAYLGGNSNNLVWDSSNNKDLRGGITQGTWCENVISGSGSGSGDMLYADFNWVTKTGATITLDLNSYIEPSADFTVNAPSTIEDGQRYILRVVTGATPYTMTLGTGITNPYSESTTLLANTVHQFGFLAVDGNLELQPSVTQSGGGTWGTITGTLSDQTDLNTALGAKANATDLNTKAFYLTGTTGQTNLDTATAAMNRYASGKCPIIMYQKGMGYISYVLGYRFSSGADFYSFGQVSSVSNGITRQNFYKIRFNTGEGSTTVSSIEDVNDVYASYLSPYYSSSSGYFTPTSNSHPATKKYVDDNVAYVGSSAPSSPSEGRLWYDTTNDVLKSYDGTNWNECGGGVNKSWVTKTVSSGEIELGIRTLVNDPSANFTLTKPATLIDGEEYAIRINSGSTARTMTLGTGFTNPWNVSLSLNAQATDQFVFLAINNTLELQPLITIS